MMLASGCKNFGITSFCCTPLHVEPALGIGPPKTGSFMHTKAGNGSHSVSGPHGPSIEEINGPIIMENEK
jgi:hypothetical protein